MAKEVVSILELEASEQLRLSLNALITLDRSTGITANLRDRYGWRALLLTTDYLLRTTHNPLRTTQYSSLTTYYLLLITYYLLLTTHYL